MSFGKFDLQSDAPNESEKCVKKIIWWHLIQTYLNTINHMFIGTISIYMTWMAFKVDHHENRKLHIWLCTIGYQLLMCEGIMSLYNKNSWSQQHTRHTNNYLHWILQLLGSIMSIAGVIVEFISRSTHFISIHSQLGLASIILIIISIISGTTSLWSKELRELIKPIQNRFLHNFIGLFAFLLGMISLIYGFKMHPIHLLIGSDIQITLQILTAFTIVLTLFGSIQSAFSTVRTMMSRIWPV